MKNMFSKKRKIEVADCEVEVIPLELETYPRSAVTEECPPKLHNNPKEPIMWVRSYEPNQDWSMLYTIDQE